MKLIKFEKQYLLQVKELSDSLFNDGWNEQQFCDELENENSISYLLENNEKIVGFLFARKIFDVMEILDIAICKELQGNGYGKLLMQQLMDFAEVNLVKSIYLEVREDNVPAVRLYESFGFEMNRIRPNYYHDKNGLEMILRLEY